MNVSQSPRSLSWNFSQAGTSMTLATPAAARRVAEVGRRIAGNEHGRGHRQAGQHGQVHVVQVLVRDGDVSAVQQGGPVEMRVGGELVPGGLESAPLGQPRIHQQPQVGAIDPQPGVADGGDPYRVRRSSGTCRQKDVSEDGGDLRQIPVQPGLDRVRAHVGEEHMTRAPLLL